MFYSEQDKRASEEMAANRKINNEARDVKRKLEVIRKKCQEISQLGVAIGVAYFTFKTSSLKVTAYPINNCKDAYLAVWL